MTVPVAGGVWLFSSLTVFAVPCVLAVLLSRGHRWLFVAGALLAVTWWIVATVGGCRDEQTDVACEWQPAFQGFFAAAALAIWSAGVASGYGVRRLRER
jgi:hypothetical protein